MRRFAKQFYARYTTSMRYSPRIVWARTSKRYLQWLHALLILLLLMGNVATPLTAQSNGAARDAYADWEAALEAELELLMAELTVADRVGQLFMLVFPGNNTGFESDIAELIHGYRIGGVVLTPRTGNFTNQSGVDTPRAVASLANRLQSLAYGVLLPADEAIPQLPRAQEAEDAGNLRQELPQLEELTGVLPVNLPLFVAVEQTGDHLPDTTLRRGFTPLPSQMAMGATWNPELTRRVGAIAGHELGAVGVNMLLGPNLNVIESPRPDAVGSLGLHSFGGNSYWVAQQARAYIAGVHEGSEGRVATIAGHFPGAGDIDRLPQQEIATVQRSLAQLRRHALPPFWAVTRRPSVTLTPGGDVSATDGMMSSPTRYSAYQGGASGRATPLNLTPELSAVLEQEGLSAWQERGGVLVSSPLGWPSIRRYYSPTQEEFPYRRVALDAFTAGHDVLLLDQFSLDGDWETQMRNIQATIGFFQERYVNDSAFAQQVDDAVRRILRLKLRLYGYEPQAEGAGPIASSAATIELPPIPLETVLVDEEQLGRLDNEHRAAAQAVVGQVARESMTTLYPDPAAASEVLSLLPQADDDILIFTESRLLHECPGCLAEPAVGPDELADVMLRLYGPGATGQLDPDQIVSLTFAELSQVLGEATATAVPASENGQAVGVQPTDAPLGDNGDGDEEEEAAPLNKNAKINMQLAEADWIIFAMLDVDEEAYPHSDVVKRFLRERGDALGNKHIVVFALNAPYFLDTTELSKLHAYYGVYSKTQPFIENAVRGFFRSFTPGGAPPVNVPGTRFAALAERTQPDPARSIALRLLDEEGEVLAALNEEEETPEPALDVGASVRIQAGPLYDLNGKLVHDGMAVEFSLYYDGEESPTRQESASTRGGLATRELVIERPGLLRIQAQAGEAMTAPPLLVNVMGDAVEELVSDADAGGEGAEADGGAEDAGQDTPPAALDVTATLTDGVGIVGETGAGDAITPGQRLSLASFVVSMLTMAGVLGLLLVVQVRILPRRVVVQSTLWAMIFGLSAYVLYGLGLTPFGEWLETSLRVWGAAIVVLIAMLPPLLWVGLRTE